MLRIEKAGFIELLSRYPFEQDLWTKRAEERDIIFENYRTINLLKLIKSIVKNPLICKENGDMYRRKKYKLLDRIKYYRNTRLKMGLMKLFLN